MKHTIGFLDQIEPYQALERPAAAAEVVPYRRPQNISSSDEESSSRYQNIPLNTFTGWTSFIFSFFYVLVGFW